MMPLADVTPQWVDDLLYMLIAGLIVFDAAMFFPY